MSKPNEQKTIAVRQTATIKFLENGGVDVHLTGISGVSMRMIGNIPIFLDKEVNRLRAIERNNLRLAQLKKAAEVAAPIVEGDKK